MKFKIKGETKQRCVKIGSVVEMYNTLDRVWEPYQITGLRFLGDGDAIFDGKKLTFREDEKEIALFKESRFYEHVGDNLIRIKRL